MDKGIIPCGEDMADSKEVARNILWAQANNNFFFAFLFYDFLFSFGSRGRSWSLIGDFSHQIVILIYQLFDKYFSYICLNLLLYFQKKYFIRDSELRMFEEPLEDFQTDNPNRDLAPNNTLYISNLNEKVPLEELKDTIFNIFEEYGEILDIVAKKNIRMRGQAFLIFKDINSAMQAKRKVNGQQLYGKTMKVTYAKQKSDIIAKLDGTFHIRQKPENYFQQKFQQKFILRPQKIKAAKTEREKNVGRKFDKSLNLPNHILFCQGLTGDITAEKLTNLFVRYPGLVDVRLAPKNYAFIQFSDEFKAGTAMAALNGIEFEGCTLQITYAKK